MPETMTDEEYTESLGGDCPYCHETMVVSKGDFYPGRNSALAHRNALCENCLKTWTDDFVLAGYRGRGVE